MAAERLLNRAVLAVPSWAAGLIGSILGITLTVSIFLMTSGLSGPVQKVVEAWAKRIEVQATRVGETTERIEKAIARFEEVTQQTTVALRSINERLAANDERIAALQKQLTVAKLEINEVRDELAGFRQAMAAIAARIQSASSATDQVVRQRPNEPARQPLQRPAIVAPKSPNQPATQKPWWVLN